VSVSSQNFFSCLYGSFPSGTLQVADTIISSAGMEEVMMISAGIINGVNFTFAAIIAAQSERSKSLL